MQAQQSAVTRSSLLLRRPMSQTHSCNYFIGIYGISTVNQKLHWTILTMEAKSSLIWLFAKALPQSDCKSWQWVRGHTEHYNSPFQPKDSGNSSLHFLNLVNVQSEHFQIWLIMFRVRFLGIPWDWISHSGNSDSESSEKRSENTHIVNNALCNSSDQSVWEPWDTETLL